ncbi:hypothetical protein CIK68_14255 [Brachybacterium alimentarium]|nr:hypothetical protein CIK68_14255 [Brachybacterium alimentarium]
MWHMTFKMLAWPDDAQRVEVAEGLVLPDRLRGVESTPYEGQRVKLALELRAYRYRVVSLTLDVEGEREITGSTLRKLPVGHLVNGIAWTYARTPGPNGEERFSPIPQWDRPEDGPDSDTLLRVAHLFALEYASGGTPVRRIEADLDVPRSTAENWVRRAKDRGLIRAAS